MPGPKIFKKITQSGFTLLEIVIAISLIAVLTTLLLTSFGPWLRFKQRLDTDNRLRDLAQATSAFYKANAFTVDDNAAASTFVPTQGSLVAGNGDKMQALCPADNGGADFDASDVETTGIFNNLLPLQPFTTTSINDLAKDGFNNGLCVFVSPRLSKSLAGATIYYHTVAIVSLGENGRLDTGTKLVSDGAANPSWTLSLAGDDKGVLVDGYQIAAENFRITNERLQRFARAYETYFNVRYLVKPDRDISVDYFYALDAGKTNNGDPGDTSSGSTDTGPTIAETKSTLGTSWDVSSFDNVITTGLTQKLGISQSDGVDAWNNPILFDNRSSRVRAGVIQTGAGQINQLPPFTASFGSLLPGTGADATCTQSGAHPEPVVAGECKTFISATAVGSY